MRLPTLCILLFLTFYTLYLPAQAGTISTVAGGVAQPMITTYAGPQLPVSGRPAMNQAVDFPSAVVPDQAGGIYVVSTNQDRVYRIAVDGTLRLIAGTSYGFSGDAGPATAAKLAAPSGLALDGMGNLYITDTQNNRVRKVTANGVITTIAGTGMAGFSGDGGRAISAQLSGPTGIAVDMDGNVYIADTTNNRVRKIGLDGVINTVAGGGTVSLVMGADPAQPVNGLQATSAALSSPSGVAVDAKGNLYIANRFVLKVGPDGILNILTFVHGTYASHIGFFCSPDGDGGPSTAASVCDPKGLSVDTTGNLYVAEYDRVREITADGIIHTVARADVPGMDLVPFSVAAGTDGSIYISEANRNLVRKVTPGGAFTMVLANTVSGFSGDGGRATSAQLSGPSRLAVDTAGDLYIADTLNQRVRKVTADGVITTIAGSGIYGYGGDGGPAISAEMRPLRDILVDSSGNIYILDDLRVRKITTDGVINTIAGCTGVCSASQDVDGVMATQVPLNTPHTIAVDAAGTLYIAEFDRVRKVGADGIITTIFNNGAPEWGGDGGPPGLGYPNRLVFTGFALDPAGDFYIGDNAGMIRKVTPDGQINVIAGSGVCRFGADDADGGPATSAHLCPGFRIKPDTSGNLYVVEGSRARKVTADGVINTITGGNDVQGFSGDGGLPMFAQFNSLSDAALDAAGNLYLADFFNNRVRKIVPSICGEPSMTANLQPGFYIAEVRNRPGTAAGFWGMEVRPQLGSLSGGFNFGGGTFSAGGLTSFGAFFIPSSGVVHIKVNAQAAGSFSMTLRLLDANRQPVMPDKSVGLTAEFDTPALPAGFYIVEVRTPEGGPTATYQMQIAGPDMGVADAGGYLNDETVGFGAFYISQNRDVTIKLFGTSAYGTAAVACPMLTLRNSSWQVIQSAP